jgi:hypothetical protein
MKKILFNFAIAFSALTAIQSAFSQDHGHFYVGAAGTNQNDQLVITNAADFATNTGYVKTLLYTNAGAYAGYFQGNITFEALSAFNVFGDPISGSAALGSWIHAQISSVDGPADGVFGFFGNLARQIRRLIFPAAQRPQTPGSSVTTMARRSQILSATFMGGVSPRQNRESTSSVLKRSIVQPTARAAGRFTLTRKF